MTVSPTQLEGVAAAKIRGSQAAATVTLRPAIVISIDPVGTTAMVTCDGPEGGQFGAQVIYPTGIIAGDRVMVMFVPPHGVFLIGRRGGDYDNWHVVGDENEPQFASGWVNDPAAVLIGVSGLNTDTPPRAMFRRHGRIVELRGRLLHTSGGNVIFTLPPEYRPENDLTFNPSGGASFLSFCTVVVNHNGQVEGLTENSICLDGIFFSTNPTPDTGGL